MAQTRMEIRFEIRMAQILRARRLWTIQGEGRRILAPTTVFWREKFQMPLPTAWRRITMSHCNEAGGRHG
jgi:hypothetical protein